MRDLGVDVREIVVDGSAARACTACAARGTGCWWLERLLKLYDRLRDQPLARRSAPQNRRWIVERQEADGSWGGIQPPWVYSLIAL